MKIIVMNNQLNSLTGTDIYTYTLAKELLKKHNVKVFTFHKGIVSKKLPMIDKIEDCDLFLVSHNTCLKEIENQKGFKILTIHSTQYKVEKPIDGADKYVAISEEIQDYLKEKGYESTIIRNGIDCERFKPINPINEKLKNVLCISKNNLLKEAVKNACPDLNVISIGRVKKWEVEKYINKVDLVVSSGRGIYEAMACGRVAVVVDVNARWLDGIVNKDNIGELLRFNCSGRRFGKDIKELKNEIMKYDKSMGLFNRKFALNNFNIKKQVNKYLHLYLSNEKNNSHKSG